MVGGIDVTSLSLLTGYPVVLATLIKNIIYTLVISGATFIFRIY